MAPQSNDEERTNAIGLFNTAQSYWQSAAQLDAAQVRVSHPHAPVNFLFCHAIELYLKAFLRAKGSTVGDLKRFGHNVAALAMAAKKAELSLEKTSEDILSHITEEDVAIESRYLITGYKSVPSSEAFYEVSEILDKTISGALERIGIKVRRLKFEKPIPAKEQEKLKEIEEQLPELTETDREIIGYLLHHNQRMFECAWDGGNARMLIARGIVQSAQREDQIVNAENVPMEIPRPIWNLLKRHAGEFIYEGSDDDPHPWRVDWMLR